MPTRLSIHFMHGSFLFESLLPLALTTNRIVQVLHGATADDQLQIDIHSDFLPEQEENFLHLSSETMRKGDLIDFDLEEGRIIVRHLGSEVSSHPAPWLKKLRAHRRVVACASEGTDFSGEVLLKERDGRDHTAFRGVHESHDSFIPFFASSIAIFPFESAGGRHDEVAERFHRDIVARLRADFPSITLHERKELDAVDLEQQLFGGTITGAALYLHGYAQKDGSLLLYASATETDHRRIWLLKDTAQIGEILSGLLQSPDTTVSVEPAGRIVLLPFQSASGSEASLRLARWCEDLAEVQLSSREIAVERNSLGFLASELRLDQDLTIDLERAGWLLGGWIFGDERDGARLHLRLIEAATGVVASELAITIHRSDAQIEIDSGLRALLAATTLGASRGGPPLSATASREALEQYLFALNYLDDDRMDDAENALEASVLLDSSFGMARYRLFLLQVNAGRIADAEEMFDALSRDFPHYPELDESLLVAADHLYEISPAQNGDQVARMLERFNSSTLRESRWLSTALTARARILEEKGRLPEAYAAYTQVNSLPKSFKWFYLAQSDRLEQFAARKAAELENKLGIAARGGLSEEKVLAHVEQALSRQPDLFQAWYQLARIRYRRLGRGPEAAEGFRRALKLRPDYAEAWKELWLTGEDEDALERALSLKPYYPLYLHDDGRFDEAVAHRMNAHDFYASLALAARVQDRIGTSSPTRVSANIKEDLALLLQIQPYRSTYRMMAAGYFLSRGDSEEALKHLRFIVENEPRSREAEDAVEQVRSIYFARGEGDRFVRWTRFLHEGRELMAQAERYAFLDRDSDAASALRQVLTMNPESLIAREALIQWVALGRASPTAAAELRSFWHDNGHTITSSPYWKEDPARLAVLCRTFLDDRQYLELMTDAGEEMMLAGRLETAFKRNKISGELPIYSAQAIAETPVLDGRIDDGEWAAHRLPISWVRFEPYPGSTMKFTEFFLSYDDSMLYFAFRCREHPGRLAMAYQTETGSPIYFEDGVILQLDPARTMQGYYEIRFNPHGIIRTIRRGPAWEYAGLPWQPEIRWAARSNGDEWIVEAALTIPWDFPSLRKGNAWKFNPARVWHDADPVMIAPTRISPDVADLENFSMIVPD